MRVSRIEDISEDDAEEQRDGSGWPADSVFGRGQLIGMLRNLMDEFIDGDPSAEGDPLGRPQKLINRIMWNRAHAHALSEADPAMSEPFEEAYRFQTHIPLSVHRELKARLLENPVRVKVTPPKKTAKQQKDADDTSHTLEVGIETMAKREGIDIVGALCDGQILEAYGVLHWGRGKLAELPAYDPDMDGGDMYGLADDVMARYQVATAENGFPYWVEVPHPSTILWRRDRRSDGPPNGLGIVVVLRTVTLFDAQDAMRTQRGKSLSWNELENRILIYEPTESSLGETDRVDADGGKRLRLATVWTRDECYELASPAEGGYSGPETQSWQVIDYYRHDWGMPPFAIVPAVEINDPDPVVRYQPILEGVYRTKAAADRAVTLLLTLSEQMALPVYYLESKEGVITLGEDGAPLTMTRDAWNATVIPDGATLHKVEMEVNPAFIEMNKFLLEQMSDARPQTGMAEIGTGTQPWTARLQQTQASVTPKLLLRNIAQGIQVMAQSIARDIARTGLPVYVYAAGKDGAKDRSKTVGIDPEQVNSLDIDVSIDNVSGVERITLMEHMRTLLNDPNVGLTQREFIEEGEGRSDVDGVMASREAWRLWKDYVRPMREKQILAERFGQSVVVGPNGDFYGMGGQQLTPEEVLARNGISAPPIQPGAATSPGGSAGPGGGIGGPMRNQVQMPGLPALREPTSVPLQGVG